MAISGSNSNFNLGLLSFVQVFLFGLVLSNAVLSNANTARSNDLASSICRKSRNSSLCWSMLKPAGSNDALKLANYTLNLALTNAVEYFEQTELLVAAETANPELKKRYSECQAQLFFALTDIEQGKDALATGDYNLLNQNIVSAEDAAVNCLDTFKQPPPEPSELPEEAKNLGDICNVAVGVATILVGDDS